MITLYREQNLLIILTFSCSFKNVAFKKKNNCQQHVLLLKKVAVFGNNFKRDHWTPDQLGAAVFLYDRVSLSKDTRLKLRA